ncbi:MAG: ABC transporter ATP-binding protein [Saprospiraceae bacterium]
MLEINHLQTEFRTKNATVRAVDDVSFKLQKGEILGIVGESGSGKSVSSLSVLGLVPSPGKITNGEIWYTNAAGERSNLLAIGESQLQQLRGNDLAMIFQEPMTSLNPVFNCGSQIVEAMLTHQQINKTQATQKTLELFAKVQLSDPNRIFRSYPHELSGGQKQRVMIAMALANDPAILIADEPTTALDVSVQKAILELLKQLRKEIGISVIFITHDLGVVAEIADRVLVMYKGKIVERGVVKDIFQSPKHPYTKGLLACRPPLKERFRRLPVIADFMETIVTNNGDVILQEKEGSINEIKQKQVISPVETERRLVDLKTKVPLLKVQNLHTWYPAETSFFGQPTAFVKAVNDVSFEVYPGETLGLVGESGCGKTTLGRSILRLAPLRSGSIFFDNQNITALTQRQLKPLRKNFQIIFQDPYSSLNPRKTIGRAILEPMQVHGILTNDTQRRERVIELLETVNLSAEHYGRYPHEFSGGQRQRICIARALALNPRFLICDESVSALDVSVQAQVLNLLLDLRDRLNLTYIFISHDLSVVRLMADRIAVMNAGKIVEMGAAEQVFQQPQETYTKQLIAAIPKVLY